MKFLNTSCHGTLTSVTSSINFSRLALRLPWFLAACAACLVAIVHSFSIACCSEDDPASLSRHSSHPLSLPSPPFSSSGSR